MSPGSLALTLEVATRRSAFRKPTLSALLRMQCDRLSGTTKRSATNWVALGKSNVKVTRLAFGTGTFSGRVQRDLGQDEFTRLVRYAYDPPSLALRRCTAESKRRARMSLEYTPDPLLDRARSSRGIPMHQPIY